MPAKTRIKIPESVRSQLLVEVGHRCVRCLSDTPELDLHHIVPVAEGGSNSEDNLVVLCPTCHRLAHRYKLSGSQLRAYRERVVEGRNRQIIGEGKPIKESLSVELLPTLQGTVEGWYNQLVRAAAVSLRGGLDAEVAEFEYVNSRRFLPHVIAIRDVFVSRGDFPEIVSDIDVLLSLLTEVQEEMVA